MNRDSVIIKPCATVIDPDMDKISVITMPSTTNTDPNMVKTTEKKIDKSSFISLLYYQIFGIEIKPTIIQLDKNESYKKLERDPIINTMIYLADLFTNHCLPYRLSPIIISVPGVLFNLILLILVHTSSSLHRYHYVLWLIGQYFTYIFDIIDGKQARRNATQSLARHYWDHWCDTINIVITVILMITLYPSNLKYRLPSIVLMCMIPLGFYVHFFLYYCTGILLEPYSMHFWMYVYVLFLSVSVIIFDVTIFENTDYQIMLGTLSFLCTLFFIMKFVESMTSIAKSPIFSIKLLLMIFLSPLVWIVIYTVVTIYGPPANCSADNILFRCLALLVLSNYVMNIHYQQLMDLSTSFLTIDSVVFILSLFRLLIRDCRGDLILIITLIGIILLINIIRLRKRLKIFINMYPEIGFPIFIVSNKKMKYNGHITNASVAKMEGEDVHPPTNDNFMV